MRQCVVASGGSNHHSSSAHPIAAAQGRRTCGTAPCKLTFTTPSSDVFSRSVLPSTPSTRPTIVTRLPMYEPMSWKFTRGAGEVTSRLLISAAARCGEGQAI